MPAKQPYKKLKEKTGRKILGSWGWSDKWMGLEWQEGVGENEREKERQESLFMNYLLFARFF